MLGTDTATSTYIYRTHHQQLYTVDFLCVDFGDVRYIGIELEEFIGGSCTGPLLHQGTHPGDGDDRIHLFLGHTQRETQIGIRVYIGSKNGTAFIGIQSCQCGGQGGFAHTAFSGNGDFHSLDAQSCALCFDASDHLIAQGLNVSIDYELSLNPLIHAVLTLQQLGDLGRTLGVGINT